MERDSRRHGGQWRGCHSFDNIICDGDGGVPKRDGGLKMGQTYYYYYELDGRLEAHDPSLPSTSTCPYLPGQTVNTVWVPLEQSCRKRSGSMTSARGEDFKTMNPSDKFIWPRQAPLPPTRVAADTMARRMGSAPARVLQLDQRSARSPSPASRWPFSPRRLFSRQSSSSLKETARIRPHSRQGPDSRPETSQGVRSRDMSPESLRRFLRDEALPAAAEKPAETISLAIPEDVDDDDANFAASATSENLPLTFLSPPPTQRSASPVMTTSSYEVPLSQQPPHVPGSRPDRISWLAAPALTPAPPTQRPPQVPQQPQLEPQPVSRFSIDSSIYLSDGDSPPPSPDADAVPSFYHSDDDDEDEGLASGNDEDFPTPSETPAGAPSGDNVSTDGRPNSIGSNNTFYFAPSVARNVDAALSTYSLPTSSGVHDDRKMSVDSIHNQHEPPMIAKDCVDDDGGLTEAHDAAAAGSFQLLRSPIPNSGLADLINELGWMVDVINDKTNP